MRPINSTSKGPTVSKSTKCHTYLTNVTLIDVAPNYSFYQKLYSALNLNSPFENYHKFSQRKGYSSVEICATQILREIKFGSCCVSKTDILTSLAGQNLETLGNFNTLKCGIFSKIKIQGLQNAKNGIF